ncbi:efflux RND transporter periplasmic adaptor subunit (plasmid) [Enterobacter pseudoroggenkampii]
MKETYQVEYADIEQHLTMTGVLKPKEQVSVGAQVNGRLNKLHVKEGEPVKKGQLLAEIDPTLAQNDVDNAKAELNTALVQKKITSLSLRQSLSDYNRQKKMLAEDATTLSDLENAKTNYQSDKEQFSLNQIQIAQAEVKLKTAQANSDFTRITSPIDGTVVGILTQEGQTIVSSQTAPTILVVANLDVMDVNIKISEMDIMKTKIDMPLWFNVTAAPDIIYKGQLKSIQQIPADMLQSMQSNSIDSSANQNKAVYYNGSFEVTNKDRLLKPAMTVQVYLVVSEKKQVLVIPTDYLSRNDNKGQLTVNVQNKNNIEKRTVKVGIKTAKRTEVISGLEVGEILVKGSG